MPSVSGGTVTWDLDVDSSKLQSGLSEASSSVDQAAGDIDGKLDDVSSKAEESSSRISDAFKSAEAGSQIFAGALAAAGAAIGAFALSSINAFAEQQKANAQTEAVLRSTAKNRIGVYQDVLVSTKQVTNTTKEYTDKVVTATARLHDMEEAFKKTKAPTESAKLALQRQKDEVAKLGSQASKTVGVFKKEFHPEMQITADFVQQLSSEFQDATTYADDVTQSGVNMLLTFTNVGKKVLPQATTALLDMATAMGGDVTNTAIQLGKALNDPIEGSNALRRVGVALTDQQQAQIKKLVEQNKLYEAQKIILDELAVEFGGSAAAQAGTFAGKITRLKNAFGDFQELVGEFLVSKIQPFVTGMLEWLESIGGVEVVFDKLKNEILPPIADNMGVIVGVIVAGLIPAFYGLATSILAAFAPLLPFIAAGAAIGFVAQKIIEHFGGLQKTFEAIQPALALLNDLFQTVLAPSLREIGNIITTQLLPELQKLWEQISPVLIPALKLLGVVLAASIVGLLRIFSEIVEAVIQGVTGVIHNINRLIEAFKSIVPAIGAALSGVGDAIAQPFQDAFNKVKGIAGNIRDQLKEISPFTRHSPSLVDQVKSGVKIIADQFGTLQSLDMPRVSATQSPFSSQAQPNIAQDMPGQQATNKNVVVNIAQVNDNNDIDKMSREIAFRASIA